MKINLVQNEFLQSLDEFSIVTNTTPLGMRGFHAGISPFTVELIQTMPKDGIIYDIVYNPTKTELIKQAIKAERRTIGGLDMLVHQGARAFEIWTGIEPDTDKMKIAALERLLDG